MAESEAGKGSRPSRRSFLRAAAGISGATAGGAALKRAVHAAGSDAIKIGVIGCGGRGTGAAVNAMDADPGVRLVALCDLFRSRVRSARETLQRARPKQVAVDDAHCFVGFDGYKRVIESADVVLVANAGKFHPLHLKAAIEAGRHVFVEKPHAIDPGGLRQVIAACELARRKKPSVVSGLQSRFVPGYRETVRRIHDGAIGAIVAIEETILQAPYGLVRRRPGLGEVQYQCTNQKSFTWIGGGDVCQTFSHNMDRALFTAIRKGEPVTSAHHIIPTALATVMGQLSCHTGKQVTAAQVLKSNFHYPPKPEECSFDMAPPVNPGPDGLYPVRIPGETRLL